MNPSHLRRQLDPLLSDYQHAVRQVADERESLKVSKQRLVDAEEAQSIVQAVAQQVQQQAHSRISSVVTRCLRAVFGEDAYEFKIDFRQARGKTEAVLILERSGLVLEDPLNEAGGGVCDVVGFALRLVCVMLMLPQRRRFVCLDEPFRGVRGKQYQERVGELLLSLSEELDVQFLISSDFDWLKVGEVIEL